MVWSVGWPALCWSIFIVCGNALSFRMEFSSYDMKDDDNPRLL